MTDTARSETLYPAQSKSGRSVIATGVQQAWWLTLGVLATLGERTAHVAAALVEKGREIEPSVLEPVRRVATRVSDATDGAGARLRSVAGLSDVRLPPALRRVGAPSKEEFERLVEEVKDLRARLGDKIEKATGED